jgi:hypothetical protein
MLSARFCKRRDCSTFRDVVDGIECSRTRMSTDEPARDYYSSVNTKQINQIFMVSTSFCNIAQVP